MKITTSPTNVLMRFTALALIASVIPFTPLRAELIAYESFNYEIGSLSGQGSAQDREWEAAWSVGAGDPPLVVERPMGYTNGTIRIDNFNSGTSWNAVTEPPPRGTLLLVR